MASKVYGLIIRFYLHYLSCRYRFRVVPFGWSDCITHPNV